MLLISLESKDQKLVSEFTSRKYPFLSDQLLRKSELTSSNVHDCLVGASSGLFLKLASEKTQLRSYKGIEFLQFRRFMKLSTFSFFVVVCLFVYIYHYIHSVFPSFFYVMVSC